jgi:hypothetical protein
MHESEAKYGFLTTYHETIFLRQTERPGRKGEWVLWYSNVIMHGTISTPATSDRPRDYHGKVSLRECFLFLAVEGASNNHHAKNEMPLSTWTVTRKKSHSAQRDHITDDYSGPTTQRGTQTGATGPQTAPAGQQIHTTQPRLGAHPPRREPEPPSNVVTVHYDERLKQSYIMDLGGRKVFVNVRRNADGTIYFELNGKRYAAQWAQIRRENERRSKGQGGQM